MFVSVTTKIVNESIVLAELITFCDYDLCSTIICACIKIMTKVETHDFVKCCIFYLIIPKCNVRKSGAECDDEDN